MKMRIVANEGYVFTIQTMENGKWEQRQIHFDDLRKMVQKNFPKEWKAFVTTFKGKCDQDAINWFYHYGETREMRIKGIAYEYEA